MQATARQQHAQEEKARKLEERAQKQSAKEAEKAAKKAEIKGKKAARPTSTSVPKPKPLVKAKEQVAVDNSSGSKEGVGRSGKLVAVKTTRTRTVRMPQRFNKSV